MKIGKWHLIKNIGHGGNGTVWSCYKDGDRDSYAIKILSSKHKLAIQRFMDEVHVMTELKVEGVIPVVDVCINSSESTENYFYYVMPRAEKCVDRGLLTKSLAEKVPIIMSLGRVLEAMHKKGIAHRDIKLANILFYNNRYLFADFGLANYPGKEHITGSRELICARKSMDYRSISLGQHLTDNDKQEVDVCEFAKLVWAILTGEDKTYFYGQYLPNGQWGLRTRITHYSLEKLDDILYRCTDIEGELARRPKMSEFCNKFEEWWAENQNDDLRLRGIWRDMVSQVLPHISPSSICWNKRQETRRIIKILKKYQHCLKCEEKQTSESISDWEQKEYKSIVYCQPTTINEAIFVLIDIHEGVYYVKCKV